MSAEIKILTAEQREIANKGGVRKLRNEGKVPAVVYGNNKPEVNISVNQKELFIAYRKGGFFSKTIDIEVGKEKIRAIPQELQFDPVKDTPIHADFLRVDEKSKVKVSIPVEFTGAEKSPGLKRGGILNVVRRTVDIHTSVANIPDVFVADISELTIGDNVKFSDLQMPEGIEPTINDRDFTIAAIAGRVAKEASTAVVEEGEESTEDTESEES